MRCPPHPQTQTQSLTDRVAEEASCSVSSGHVGGKITSCIFVCIEHSLTQESGRLGTILVKTNALGLLSPTTRPARWRDVYKMHIPGGAARLPMHCGFGLAKPPVSVKVQTESISTQMITQLSTGMNLSMG